MAISDEVVVLFLGYLFTYMTIYKYNKVFGNIIFIVLGLATFLVSTEEIVGVVGIILTMGALANTIYEIMPGTKQKRKLNRLKSLIR